ncbi:M48 family metallopeptidase [Flavobacterium sandaracinum]|uniref:M48 family peptidase n=1 Tax=Flavobacterium sandaracinum TaxID=2541733 RepID=A0A4R5D7Y1_9FLAO|nr:SprT family zinc-dependent metalloprotease [Flavobacterium sandaracinum]TDE07831.1 M48 family peptidase [Flavobacterium sandaracinum]
MLHTLNFGSKEIVYTILYTKRKTLGITVNPDMGIVVKAPVESSFELIEAKVRKRAPWIIKQLNFFLTFYPKPNDKKYVTGESHFYLGKQYRIEIIEDKKNEVHYKGRYIQINTKNKNKAKELLNDWYRIKAKEKFQAIAEPIIEKFKKYNVEPTGIYIQEMKTRWGSCTPEGKIILNPELVKTPKGCIEYVIIHELCHLVHHNHTQKFFDLQTKENPLWERWKKKLEEFG